jgi:CxxC motif-containing protein (DUF1111 family)
MNFSWQVTLRTYGEIACQISVAVQLALPGVGVGFLRCVEAREDMPPLEIL